MPHIGQSIGVGHYLFVYICHNKAPDEDYFPEAEARVPLGASRSF